MRSRRRRQPRAAAAPDGRDVRPRADRRGFLGYLFVYQAITSLAALRGYGQFVVGSARNWK